MSVGEATAPELRPATELAANITGESKVEEVAESDPRDSVNFPFDFDHKDPRGKRWAGKFTNRILSIKQIRQVKVLKATLAGNLPVSALDQDIWVFNEMLAHLTISLDRSASDFPKWADKLEDLYDEEIITKLYEVVMNHEARFHRREKTAAPRADADDQRPG